MKKITTRLPLLILAILCLNSFSALAQPGFIINGGDVCENASVEVSVSVEEFTEMISFQYTIGWNPSVIQIDSVSNVNGAISDNILFGSFNSESDVLTLSWFDNALEGITLADDEVLFSIFYTVVGDNSSLSMVTFENEPTMQEVSSLDDMGEIVMVNAGFSDGMIMVAQPELGSVVVTDDVNMTSVGAIDITISNGTAPYTFVWETGQTTEDLTDVPVGEYLCTVTDAKGCISDIGPFTVGNIVSTNEIETLIDVQAFPNPTAGHFNFKAQLERPEVLEITIYNILGENIYFEQLESANIERELDLSRFANGTYFLQLSVEDGLYVERIQVQH